MLTAAIKRRLMSSERSDLYVTDAIRIELLQIRGLKAGEHNGYRVIRGVKRLGRGANYPLPSSADVNIYPPLDFLIL